MIYQGIYQDRPAIRQIGILLLIIFACTCLSMLPLVVLQALAPDPMAPSVLRASLFIQDLFLFILAPILAQLLLFRENFNRTFGLQGAPLSIFLTGILSILTITPVIDFLSEWNKSLQLPDSLATLQLKMEQYEQSAEQVLQIILNSSQISILCLNLFLIAIMASVGEELLFRGLIQKLLFRWTGKAHAAVWITAFIFSAIHMQFFGFIPRLVLGALLGYLFLYSRSLWVCIAVHAFNNALTLLALPGQPYNRTWEWTHTLQHTGTSPIWIGSSILLTGFCIGYIYRTSLKRFKYDQRI